MSQAKPEHPIVPTLPATARMYDVDATAPAGIPLGAAAAPLRSPTVLPRARLSEGPQHPLRALARLPPRLAPPVTVIPRPAEAVTEALAVAVETPATVTATMNTHALRPREMVAKR